MAIKDRGIALRKSVGMTMIELLVGITVMGIGLTIAIPGFQGMIARNNLATQVNEFLLTVNRARSEASRRGGTVSIQALGGDTGIDAADEFGGGWCILSGGSNDPGNCAGGVIMRVARLSRQSTLNLVNAGGASSIQFNGMGGLAGDDSVDVDFCDSVLSGRRVHINLVGRSKSHKADDPNVARRPDCG
jgi:type IV fimbrial biogenesis protein FimT